MLKDGKMMTKRFHKCDHCKDTKETGEDKNVTNEECSDNK